MRRFIPRKKPLSSEVQPYNCAAPSLWRRKPYGVWVWDRLYNGEALDSSNNRLTLPVTTGTPVFDDTLFGVCPSRAPGGSDWHLTASSANRGPVGTVFAVLGMKYTSGAQTFFAHDDGTNGGFRIWFNGATFT